jgi:hypothetical protein
LLTVVSRFDRSLARVLAVTPCRRLYVMPCSTRLPGTCANLIAVAAFTLEHASGLAKGRSTCVQRLPLLSGLKTLPVTESQQRRP